MVQEVNDTLEATDSGANVRAATVEPAPPPAPSPLPCLARARPGTRAVQWYGRLNRGWRPARQLEHAFEHAFATEHAFEGVVSPTEESLREHNEELAAHDASGAAVAAAAVLNRLPIAAGSASDWCEQSWASARQ